MAHTRVVKLVCSLLWITLVAIDAQTGFTYPANEYEYSIRRDYLLDRQRDMEANNITLTQDEEIVDRYLEYRKQEHFTATKYSGFPPLRPIQEVKSVIESSEVYRLLKTLPKGGNMHTHENHELSKTKLYDIVWNSTDFQHLYILPENHTTDPWKLDFFINPPPGEGWMKVENHPTLDRATIQEKQHLIGILSDEAERYPSDSNIRWDQMNTLWGRGSSQLIANIDIKTSYIWALYESALEEGVQYLETRKNFGPAEMLYELSTDPVYDTTNGKKFLDTTGELDIQVTMNITKAFIEERPEFIGHRRIMYTTRYSDLDDILADMTKAITFYGKYPEHFRGFDMVAEEDAGRSHIYFLEDFIHLYDPATQQSKVPIYLHTGETSWAGDLMTSEFTGDLVATAQNTYDAIVMGAFRVGHGLAYINYPSLLEELKTRGVAVEVCPVSNQILGLQADLRNHPAQHYLRMGIPLVLGADDPGSFGYDHYTTDWYEAYMGWGLNLRQLKKLSQNSITYSTMNAGEKQAAFDKWTPFWNTYISSVTTEACNANLDQNQPEFHRIIPREGAITGSTNVHIYGRNFERAVCKTVRCKFGDIESGTTYYVSMSHLICEAPPGDGTTQFVNVSVSLDELTYMETGETFIYIHPPMTTTAPDEYYDASRASLSPTKHSMMFYCVVILALRMLTPHV